MARLAPFLIQTLKANDKFGAVGRERECGYMDMWIYGYADVWINGYVDIWQYGDVDMLICGYIDMRM